MTADDNSLAPEGLRLIDLHEGLRSGCGRYLPEPEIRPAPVAARQTRLLMRDMMGLDDTEIDALIGSSNLEEIAASAPQALANEHRLKPQNLIQMRNPK